MTDNRTTELESLSKLKMAGKLRYWRGTIEIPETELHAICDEMQAEHDRAIAATLGSNDGVARSNNGVTAEQVRKAIFVGGIWDEDNAMYYVNRTDMQTIADELNAMLCGGRVNEDSIDKWLREFQIAHGELAHIGPDELKDLAFALHDDIPLGYEASMRLGQWLLNAELGSEREKRLEKLVSDLWQSHECGAGCAMYEECRHPLDDRCPMEERVAELGSGTLTAEQVRKAIFSGSVYASYDGSQYYANGIDMQAIADELNGLLGSETCEPNWVLQGETQTQEFWRCECGNCGECFGVETRESFPLKITIDKVDVPNYCPNCGRKVR